MKPLLAIVLTLALADPALAVTRYKSTSLTCDAIKSAIAEDGAVILRYPNSAGTTLLYDRFVSNGNYCDSHQIAERISVPAADTRRCRVYHCVSAPDRCDRPGAFCEFRRIRK